MRANQRHYSIYGGHYAIVSLPSSCASTSRSGSTKRDIAQFVYERARIRRAEWGDVGKGAVVRDRGDSVYTALDSRTICWWSPRAVRRAASAPSFRLDGPQDRSRTAAIGACVDCEPPEG